MGYRMIDTAVIKNSKGFKYRHSPSNTAQGQDILGCVGDLVRLPRNGTYRAYYGFLWWLIGDSHWTY